MKVSEMMSAIQVASNGNNQINLTDEVGNGVIFIAKDCDTDEVVILTSEDSEGISVERAMELLAGLEPDATVVTSENVYIDTIKYECVARPVLVCSKEVCNDRRTG